jgi:outer membrane protein assembly factor BamD (BamD/ComL family)
MKTIKIALVFSCFVLASCSSFSFFSRQVTISEGATAAQIIQLGQAAMDKDRYNQAIQYYKAVLERFPNDKISACGAEYEIAFIHYKQKKYGQAREGFSKLLGKYNGPGSGDLPQKYQILSHIVLNKITEKQKILADE